MSDTCNCSGCTTARRYLDALNKGKPACRPPPSPSERVRDWLMVRAFEEYAAMLWVEPGDTVH